MLKGIAVAIPPQMKPGLLVSGLLPGITGWADSNVGWVSDSVTHAGVGFRASAQPTSTYI
ncbi:hypothetical protein C8255_22780 [filamentous cyanobacterium CCP3]|nr:hypothetical protein C8255_22780 [filamentous cyanobacterium CCP3]